MNAVASETQKSKSSETFSGYNITMASSEALPFGDSGSALDASETASDLDR
jgi:hypothetical protein